MRNVLVIQSEPLVWAGRFLVEWLLRCSFLHTHRRPSSPHAAAAPPASPIIITVVQQHPQLLLSLKNNVEHSACISPVSSALLAPGIAKNLSNHLLVPSRRLEYLCRIVASYSFVLRWEASCKSNNVFAPSKLLSLNGHHTKNTFRDLLQCSPHYADWHLRTRSKFHSACILYWCFPSLQCEQFTALVPTCPQVHIVLTVGGNFKVQLDCCSEMNWLRIFSDILQKVRMNAGNN